MRASAEASGDEVAAYEVPDCEVQMAVRLDHETV